MTSILSNMSTHEKRIYRRGFDDGFEGRDANLAQLHTHAALDLYADAYLHGQARKRRLTAIPRPKLADARI